MQKTTSEIIFTPSAATKTEVKGWAEKVKNTAGNIFRKAIRDETNHFAAALQSFMLTGKAFSGAKR